MCLTLLLFLAAFMINLLYMQSVIARYNARLQNHRGDGNYFLSIGLLSVVFIALSQSHHFQKIGNGLPIANFKTIISNINMKPPYYEIQETNSHVQHWYESDPYLNYFFISDIDRLLPTHDPICPDEGFCSEEREVLIRFELI